MKGGRGLKDARARAREITVQGIGSRARARVYIYWYGRLLLYAMGAAASFEAVSHMNKKELAAYADNEAPVGHCYKENEQWTDLSVLTETDVEGLGKL